MWENKSLSLGQARTFLFKLPASVCVLRLARQCTPSRFFPDGTSTLHIFRDAFPVHVLMFVWLFFNVCFPANPLVWHSPHCPGAGRQVPKPRCLSPLPIAWLSGLLVTNVFTLRPLGENGLTFGACKLPFVLARLWLTPPFLEPKSRG